MKLKKILLLFITVLSIFINIILIIKYESLRNEFNSYSNKIEIDMIEKDININLYNESLKMMENINCIYDDIEELSKYEYEALDKKEPTTYELNETGEFQSCRDNLFQIFSDIYICYDLYGRYDGVYFEYYSKQGFLSHSNVCLCWLVNAPNENYIYNADENNRNITMEKYINIYDNLYIIYYYYIDY